MSSEGQLNTNASERLFLYVAEINSASAETKGAFTIADVVKEVEAELGSPIQCELLVSKLATAGYFEEDDYSDSLWSEGITSYYEVRDGFPRLCSGNIAPGVRSVSYHVDLNFCDEFLIGREDVLKSME